MVRLPAIAALLATAALASCGGGDGSASMSTTPAAAPSSGPAATGDRDAVGSRTPRKAAAAEATPASTTPKRRHTVPRALAGRSFIASEVDGRLLKYGTVIKIEFGDRLAVAFTGPEHDRVCSYVAMFVVSIQGDRLRFARPPGGGVSEAPDIECDYELFDQKRWLANWLPSRLEFTLGAHSLVLRDRDNVRVAFTEN